MSDLPRIEGKVDAIQSDIAEIKTTLALNTQSLKEHMRRTEVLEHRVDSIWSKALIVVSILSGIAALLKLVLG